MTDLEQAKRFILPALQDIMVLIHYLAVIFCTTSLSIPELLQEGTAKKIITDRTKLFSQNLGMSE